MTKVLYMAAREEGVHFVDGFAEELAVRDGKAYGVFLNGGAPEVRRNCCGNGRLFGSLQIHRGLPPS